MITLGKKKYIQKKKNTWPWIRKNTWVCFQIRLRYVELQSAMFHDFWYIKSDFRTLSNKTWKILELTTIHYLVWLDWNHRMLLSVLTARCLALCYLLQKTTTFSELLYIILYDFGVFNDRWSVLKDIYMKYKYLK